MSGGGNTMGGRTDVAEYGRLREAFVRVYGELVREPQNQLDDDGRAPNEVCWVAKNVWRYPNNPNKGDVQINAWHGNAWVSDTESDTPSQILGLWCGLNIEFKPAFRNVLPFATAESITRIAQELDKYRVSFGRKCRSGEKFTVIDCGRYAADVDYQRMVPEIRQLTYDRNQMSRPQLQIYRQIGGWLDASNTVDRLEREIVSVRSELSDLFRLVTGGFYPPLDTDGQ